MLFFLFGDSQISEEMLRIFELVFLDAGGLPTSNSATNAPHFRAVFSRCRRLPTTYSAANTHIFELVFPDAGGLPTTHSAANPLFTAASHNP